MRVPRVRFTILGMMAVVMIAALVVNWLRPVTQNEAERIAVGDFLKVPGAAQWAGRYQVHAWSSESANVGDLWIVDFTESGDRTHLAQVVVTSKGKTHALGLAPGKFK